METLVADNNKTYLFYSGEYRHRNNPFRKTELFVAHFVTETIPADRRNGVEPFISFYGRDGRKYHIYLRVNGTKFDPRIGNHRKKWEILDLDDFYGISEATSEQLPVDDVLVLESFEFVDPVGQFYHVRHLDGMPLPTIESSLELRGLQRGLC